MDLLQKIKKLPRLLLVCLAFVLLLNVYLAWRDSQTVDEGPHLAAGYSYLTTNNFQFNPEHPVLFKELAGAMILPLNTKPAKELDGWSYNNQWPAGRDLIYNSVSSSRKILFMGRLPSIVITLLLVVSIYYLGRRLFNEKVGLLASVLISFDPTLNGHGHLITNDVFLALGGTVFLLTALKYYEKPTRKALLLLSLGLLLAINTKFTGLVFVPIAVAIVVWKKRHHFLSMIKGLAVMTMVVFIGTWSLYGFQMRSINEENIIGPPGDMFVEETTHFARKHPFMNRLYDIKLPAYSYIRGVGTLYSHNKDGHTTYFFGSRDRHGNLLYFPVAMMTKLPVIIIAGAFTAVLALLLRYKKLDREVRKSVTLCLVLAGLFVAIAVGSGINIGVRHVFGAWPFVYILAAFVLSKIFKNLNRRGLLLIFLMGIIYIPVLIGSIRWPLAYQNEIGETVEHLADRPILIDSNRDWGQDVRRLREYLDKNNISSFGEGIFANYIPSDIFWSRPMCTVDPVKPICTSEPAIPLPCTLAISDTARWLESDTRYTWPLYSSYHLDGRVGGSISIYTCNK